MIWHEIVETKEFKKIDYDKAFSVLPTILGLQMKFEGGLWKGAYYMNGEPHHRSDKLVARLTPNRDGIQLLEAGGSVCNIWKWLKEYGGCKNNREVCDRLLMTSTAEPIIKNHLEVKTKYVEDDTYKNLRKIALDDPFYKYLLTLFPKEQVNRVIVKYNVCSRVLNNGKIATCFWYINKDNKVCYDKMIVYNSNGHRNKDFGGMRTFKTIDGYRNKCYFGEHLLNNLKDKQRVFIVESEKTAILLALKYPKNIYLASGGVNNLNKVEDYMQLLPDYDEAGYTWINKYPNKSIKWWDKFKDVQHGWDMADVIINQLKTK